MLQANKSSRRGRKDHPPPIRAATGFLFLSAVFLAACPPPPSAPLYENAPMRPGSRWDTTDLDYAEKVGQETLEKIGYKKIIRIAVEAGWIEHRLPRSGNSFDQTLGFWAVFTRYAVAAGVTSQADSPAPGPADAVAVGILVIGLVDAGLLGGHILNSIAESPPITGPTAAPPVPMARPTSGPAPTVIPTAMATAAPTTTAPPMPATLEKEKRCEEERDAARKICRDLLTLRNPPRRLTGGYSNIADCIRGHISEECGGNKVDWGSKGPPGRK